MVTTRIEEEGDEDVDEGDEDVWEGDQDGGDSERKNDEAAASD